RVPHFWPMLPEVAIFPRRTHRQPAPESPRRTLSREPGVNFRFGGSPTSPRVWEKWGFCAFQIPAKSIPRHRAEFCHFDILDGAILLPSTGASLYPCLTVKRKAPYDETRLLPRRDSLVSCVCSPG